MLMKIYLLTELNAKVPKKPSVPPALLRRAILGELTALAMLLAEQLCHMKSIKPFMTFSVTSI